MKIKNLYMTCFDQAFSPCGKYLAVSNNFGSIAIFSIELAISPTLKENGWKSFFVFIASHCSIYCLKTEQSFLIGGTDDGNILAWKWSDLLHKKNIIVWTLTIPKNSSNLTIVPEINSIDILNENNVFKLFAGCGDGCIHSWDLNTHKYQASFKGHGDYIHQIVLMKRHQKLVSASEDGTLKIWDLRDSKNCLHTINPSTNTKAVRENVGKWISFVSVDNNEDWIVCGGGPCMSVWHQASFTLTSLLDNRDVTTNCAIFYEDKIITGGCNGMVTHWTLGGEKKIEIESSSTNIFNIAINKGSKSNKVMSICGNSDNIDICTNFSYKAFTLNF